MTSFSRSKQRFLSPGDSHIAITVNGFWGCQETIQDPTEGGSWTLQFTQMPTSRDLGIFVQMTDIQNDHFTPCACTRGNGSTVKFVELSQQLEQ